MDAAHETAESSKENADRVLPPLRLVHLLLYIVVASIYLTVAMSRHWNPPVTLLAASDARYWQIISTPPALWNAATTTVVILLFTWTCQRRNVWREPGHWLALWFVWNWIERYIGNYLFQLVRILARVGLKDDWSHFWPWAKSVHGIPYLFPATIAVALAIGCRGVANTWPWRIYFALLGVWLWSIVVSNLPYDWGNAVRAALPGYEFVTSVAWIWQPRVLCAALANDLLPGRPRRHWSHWVPSVQSLLASYYAPFPNIVWNLRNPPHKLPWN
jgi:hypothetical protein